MKPWKPESAREAVEAIRTLVHPRHLIQALLLTLLSSCPVQAQPVPVVTPGTTRSIGAVQAGTVEKLPLNLELSAGQGASLHVVYTDRSVAISLVLPNAAVVSPSNASSLGYQWNLLTRTGPDNAHPRPAGDEMELLVIGLPPGAPAGLYHLRVDARAATPNSSILVQAAANSGLAASLFPAQDRYLPEEPVVFTGIVTEGARILQNPTMTLLVEHTAPVGSGLSMTNVRCVRSQPLPDGRYRHDFTGDLVSQGVTAKLITAQVDSLVGTVNPARDRLSFPAVRAGSTSTTSSSISIDTESAAAPAPSGLAWSFESTGDPVPVPLRASPTQRESPAAGLFTGLFIPEKIGRYSASLTVSGATTSGAPYRQTASAGFRVEAEEGNILACSDRPVDEDGDGFYDRLEATLQVFVSQPARYSLDLQLRDASGKTVSAGRWAKLSAGDHTVLLQFSAHRLTNDLSADGPYQRAKAELWFSDNGHNDRLVSVACGTTRPYPLASFAPDPVRFTAAGTLTPVNEDGIAGYRSLNFVQPLIAPKGHCHWHAALLSADGTRLDSYNGNSDWPGGAGTVTSIFSGPKINHSGKNGPYKVDSLSITCAAHEAYRRAPATSGPYSAADFDATPADFTISSHNITAQAGVKARTAVFTKPLGGMEADIDFSLSDVPSGWTAALQLPKVDAGGAVNLDIVPAVGAAEGAYPLTITGVSGNLKHSVQITVVVTPKPVRVLIEPGSAVLHPGQTKQFSAQVLDAPDPSFEWKTPMLGTLTAGLYQAPAVIPAKMKIYVVAASTMDANKLAGAHVDLYPPAQLTVTPTTATLSAGQTQKLVADAQNVQDPSVQWTMTPQVGTLTTTSGTRATYAAPSTLTSPQTITITATSVEDPSQSTTMTITLQP